MGLQREAGGGAAGSHQCSETGLFAEAAMKVSRIYRKGHVLLAKEIHADNFQSLGDVRLTSPNSPSIVSKALIRPSHYIELATLL